MSAEQTIEEVVEFALFGVVGRKPEGLSEGAE
jgi:hypothetical protein